MSETDPAGSRADIWIEKYRPETLDEIVGHEDITQRLARYIERNDLPNLLFSGPAGTGKCVTGDTPVLTNRGIERIGDLAGDGTGFTEPPHDLRVVTYDPNAGFRYVAPSHVYSETTRDTLTLETRDGLALTVTPEHKLLALTPNGPRWRPAHDLRPGAQIARPRRAPLPPSDDRIPWLDRVDAPDTIAYIPQPHATKHAIPVEPEHTPFPTGTPTQEQSSPADDPVRAPETPVVPCPLTALADALPPTTDPTEFVRVIHYPGPPCSTNHPITPPRRFTPELAEFLGLLATTGTITPTAVRFTAQDSRLLDRVTDLTNTLFGVSPPRAKTGTTDTVRLLGTTLPHLLRACFPTIAGEPTNRPLGELLLRSGPTTTAAFLRAILHAADTTPGTPTTLRLDTDALTILTSYLFATFGIPTRRVETPHTDGVYLELPDTPSLQTLREHLTPELPADNPRTPALRFDTIQTITPEHDPVRVYDLTVPQTRNYVAGRIPALCHNTTAAIAIAKQLYGPDWRNHFLELNASDERGIDVVRDRIKHFARSSFGGHDHRIVFLDEADALTSDAQAALRRTMEQFSHNTRFILSCNFSSRIIDPIQSRCAVYRFGPIADDAVASRIRAIADTEGIEITDDGIDALVYAAAGDMRKAINGLQAASVMGGVVDADAVYTITTTARPEDIQEMVDHALAGDFHTARGILTDLLAGQGLAGGDIIKQLHRAVWDFDLTDEDAVSLIDRIGEADYRITEGANEQLQLEALLAAVALQNRPT